MPWLVASTRRIGMLLNGGKLVGATMHGAWKALQRRVRTQTVRDGRAGRMDLGRFARCCLSRADGRRLVGRPRLSGSLNLLFGVRDDVDRVEADRDQQQHADDGDDAVDPALQRRGRLGHHRHLAPGRRLVDGRRRRRGDCRVRQIAPRVVGGAAGWVRQQRVGRVDGPHAHGRLGPRVAIGVVQAR